jgi:hypothetical protein
MSFCSLLFCLVAFSRMTAFGIVDLIVTLGITDMKHKGTQDKYMMPYVECCYSECRYTECHYSACHYAV